MPRLCLSSDSLEARHQPRVLGRKKRSNIKIEARTTVEPDQAGPVKDEERLYISEAIPFH